MPNAFKIAALKNQAETYISHGLYKEALTLYAQFISDNRNLSRDMLVALEKSICQIRSTIRDGSQDENDLISEVEITLLKKGWDDQSTDEDRITSAGAFVKLGYYQHALEEYQRLLAKRCMKATVFKGAALCLAHLNQPEKFAGAVDRFTQKTFDCPKNRQACKVIIARAIGSVRFPRHFSVLCRHLAKISWDSDHPE